MWGSDRDKSVGFPPTDTSSGGGKANGFIYIDRRLHDRRQAPKTVPTQVNPALEIGQNIETSTRRPVSQLSQVSVDGQSPLTGTGLEVSDQRPVPVGVGPAQPEPELTTWRLKLRTWVRKLLELVMQVRTG